MRESEGRSVKKERWENRERCVYAWERISIKSLDFLRDDNDR